MIYIVVLFLLFFLILKYDIKGSCSKETPDNNVWSLLLLVVLLSIPIFSYEMGSDIQNYKNWYNEEVKPLDSFSFNDFRYEPLFCLTISLFKTIGLSWFIVHGIIICFINIAVFFYGRKYVKPFYTFILLYFLLYFYEMNFEPIRQSIAMGIFLFSIPLMEKRRFKAYLIWIGIAFGFHISSFFALILLFSKRIKFNVLSYFVLFIILIIGNIVNSNFSNMIVFASLVGGDDYYEMYHNSDLVNNQLNINGIIALLVLKVLPVIFSVKMIKAKCNIQSQHLETAAFMLVFFMVLRAAIPLFDRFVLYWGVIHVVVIAEGLYIYNIPSKSLFVNYCLRIYFLISFFIATFMYYIAENEYGFKNYRRFYPYSSVFEKQIDYDRRNKQL